MNKGRFIVVLGPVGVGKSTVIRHLMRIYSARGFGVSSVFMKSYHGPSYLLWTLVAKLLGLPGRYAPWFEVPRSGRINTARALTWLSMYLDLFMLMLKLFKTLLLRGFGFVVLSEEYFQSTIIDYTFACTDLNMNGTLCGYMLGILYSLMVKYEPDHIVMLNASINTLKARWHDRGYGDPQMIYVSFQRAMLRRLLNNGKNIININTDNMTVSETIHAITKVIDHALH